MPYLVQYTLQTEATLIEKLDLLTIETPLCMDGLYYELKFNGRPISYSSEPVYII